MSFVKLRLTRFLIVGSFAAMLQFGATFSLIRLSLRPAIATCLAFFMALTFAYIAQRRWTFASQERHSALLPRYVMAQLAVAMVTSVVAELIGGVSQASDLQVAAAATVIAGILSYGLSSLWVFRS